ncbi:MAG: S1 RNA-binding domain-containing protein, partial [Bacilli bacterium]|nr:S1 RNA-binding domain-containing protein [Bacilli bacterium]
IVSIYKAGDVIPAVGEPLIERRTGTEKPFQMIENCPICGSKIIRKESEADYFCPNVHCPARHVESLIHFASKDAMNIEGLGDAIMEDLYNYGYVKDITRFVRVGDTVRVKIIDIDESTNQVRLSLKALHKKRAHGRMGMFSHKATLPESKLGFLSIEKQLPIWIQEAKKGDRR